MAEDQAETLWTDGWSRCYCNGGRVMMDLESFADEGRLDKPRLQVPVGRCRTCGGFGITRSDLVVFEAPSDERVAAPEGFAARWGIEVPEGRKIYARFEAASRSFDSFREEFPEIMAPVQLVMGVADAAR